MRENCIKAEFWRVCFTCIVVRHMLEWPVSSQWIQPAPNAPVWKWCKFNEILRFFFSSIHCLHTAQLNTYAVFAIGDLDLQKTKKKEKTNKTNKNHWIFSQSSCERDKNQLADRENLPLSSVIFAECWKTAADYSVVFLCPHFIYKIINISIISISQYIDVVICVNTMYAASSMNYLAQRKCQIKIIAIFYVV